MGSPRWNVSRRQALAGLGAGLSGVLGVGFAPVFRSETRPSEPPTIVGHRGAQGLAPPNTLAAIRAGLDAGVDGVELDVWRTADGKLLLFHDAVLDWDSTASGLIESTTWAEIRGATIDGVPLVTLTRALEEIEDTDVDVYLDLKADGITDQVLETVATFDMLDRLTLLSFSRAALEPGRRAGIPTGLVGTLPTKDLVQSAMTGNADLVLSHYMPRAAPRFVEYAREVDLDAGIWQLVELSSTLRDSLETEPDVLVTNYPDRANALLGGT